MKKRPFSPKDATRDSRAVRRLALSVFLGALATRLLFWQATPDRAWGWTAYFQGDAPLWLDWARAIEVGTPFELGLPIHPPGAAYLAALFLDGVLRFAWVLLGALVPLLVFLAAHRSFGFRIAAFAGGWSAIANGLLVLSTSIDSETPYLVLAIGALWFTEDLRGRPKIGRLAAWSAANGLACLFRVEHVLFFLIALGFFALGWMRDGGSRGVLRWAFASLFFFAIPLVPWHLSSWAAIRRFNEELRRLNPTEKRAVSEVERQLAGLPWTADARAERDRLPAFLRRTASAFVLATVAYRGGREVRGEDFAILDQAFGYRPKPLCRYPFVSSYGPLNFALANNARCTGAFDRSLLEDPPPLGGGASSYPPFLVQGLPPADLTFVYPPHLRLFNEGYSIGGAWIREHPGDFARLAAKKIATFWSGAASGLTGWNLPVGLSGIRRPVDIVVPDPTPLAIGWRIALLAACAAGIFVARRRGALAPWLLFLATRLAATVLFFGYARQGALSIPVVALLFAFVVERVVARPARLVAAVLLIGAALETTRTIARPQLSLDGRVVGNSDPLPADGHGAHRVEVRVP